MNYFDESSALGRLFSAYGINSSVFDESEYLDSGTEARNVLLDRVIKIYKTKINVGDISDKAIVFCMSLQENRALELMSEIRNRKFPLEVYQMKTYFMPRVLTIDLPTTKKIISLVNKRDAIMRNRKGYNIPEVANNPKVLTGAMSAMYDMSYYLNGINDYVSSGKLILTKSNIDNIFSHIKTLIEEYALKYKQCILYFDAPYLLGTGIGITITDAQLKKVGVKPALWFCRWLEQDPDGFKSWLKKYHITLIFGGTKKELLPYSYSDTNTSSLMYTHKYMLKAFHILDGKPVADSEEIKEAIQVVDDNSKITEAENGSKEPLHNPYTDREPDPIDKAKNLVNDTKDETKNIKADINNIKKEETSKEPILNNSKDEAGDDVINFPSNTGDSNSENLVVTGYSIEDDIKSLDEEFEDEEKEFIDETKPDAKYLNKKAAKEKPYLKILEEHIPDNEKAVKLNEIHNYTSLKESVESSEVKEMRKSMMRRFGKPIDEVVQNIRKHNLKPIKFNINAKDSAYNHAKFDSYEKTYKEVLSHDDFENILTNPSKLTYPMFLQDYETKDITTYEFKGEEVKVSYTTHNGEDLEFTLDKPTVVNEETGQLLIGGSLKNITRQDAPKPVIKTGENVIVSTAYNKVFLTLRGKFASSEAKRLIKLMYYYSKESSFLRVKTTEELGDFIYNNYVSYNLIHLNKHFAGFINNHIDIDLRGIALIKDEKERNTFDEKFPEFKGKPITILGKYHNHNLYHEPETDKIITTNKVYNTNDFIHMILSENDKALFNRLYNQRKSTLSGINTIYAKLMGKDIPLIYVLMVSKPLQEILDILKESYKLEYKIVSNEILDKNPVPNDFGYGVIRLYDKSIVMKYNNYLNEILLLPLVMKDMTEYEVVNITTMMSDLVGNYNTQLYIENFAEFFIDPMTARVCEYYNIPDDFVGIFLYAASLFTTHKTSYTSDATNYRLLTIEETINRCMYEVISKELSGNMARMKRGSRPKIGIPKDALIKRLQELPNMAEANNLSPFRTIRMTRAKSYKGQIGMNMDRAYTWDARFFNPKSYGAETGGMAFTANAGITKDLPVNVEIKDLTGEYDLKNDPNAITPAQAFAFVEAYVPYLTHDSNARYLMTSSQFAHVLSVEEAAPRLVSSRVDEMAIKLAPEHGYVSKQDGIVLDVNERFITIELKDGTVDVVPLYRVPRNADKGYFTPNRLVLNKDFKKGDKIKENDIIAYNDLYYKKRTNGQLSLCDGPVVNCLVTDADGVWEDSTLISQNISHKLATRIVKRRARVLSLNTEIRDYNVSLGESINPSDILFKYKALSDDLALNEFFSNLSSIELKEVEAHHKGKIVDIRLYYRTSPTVTMSESMKTFIKTVDDIQRTKEKMSTLTESSSKYQQAVYNSRPIMLTRGSSSKVYGETIENGEILIEYYIEILDNAGSGDKLVISRALKQEPTRVIENDERPIGVDSGRECDLIFDTYSCLARMTGGMLLEGKLNAVVLHQAIRSRMILNIPPEKGSLLDYKSSYDQVEGLYGYGMPCNKTVKKK